MELKLVRSKYGTRGLAREFGTGFCWGLKYKKNLETFRLLLFTNPFSHTQKELLKSCELSGPNPCVFCVPRHRIF
jgi:hypothetical protein